MYALDTDCSKRVRQYGQVDVVSIVELKQSDTVLRVPAENDQQKRIIGQAVSYAQLQITAQPWRSQAYCMVTNGSSAIIVEAKRIGDPTSAEVATRVCLADNSSLFELLAFFFTAPPDLLGWQPLSCLNEESTPQTLSFTGRLGVGGSSIVYQASLGDRSVAVKVRRQFDRPSGEQAILSQLMLREKQILRSIWESQDEPVLTPRYLGSVNGSLPWTLIMEPVGEGTELFLAYYRFKLSSSGVFSKN